ncbi:MAG: hypothetical protein HQ541_00135 [Mariniphaga sp.]|nr:hypothetical protein [Mariniphaga sp.]
MKIKSALRFMTLIIVAFVLMSWGRSGHRIISLKSALSFNEDMNQFWDWADYLSSHASDPDIRRNSAPEEGPMHYIDIDNYPEFKETGKIPMVYSEVVEKHGKEFVTQQGTLPWATLNTLDSITKLFFAE